MDVESVRGMVCRFGEFELELQSGQLWRAGAVVRLAAQPAKVLAVLVTHAGGLVSREEIQLAVWGEGAVVGLGPRLNFCIRQIRAALGDDAESPRFIETYPKRGYRFIAAVEEVHPAGAAHTAPDRGAGTRDSRARSYRLVALVLGGLIAAALGSFLWQRAAAQRIAIHGRVLLAVLPLQSWDAGADRLYLSDGLTEELITELSRVAPDRLGVIARTSAMQYRNTTKRISQIGHQLGASYIVQGALRQAEDRIRINIQLIRVSDQSYLWAETFDRGMSNALAWQTDLSRAVAREVGARLAVQEIPHSAARLQTNPAAYEAYLKGRYYGRTLNRAGVDKAIAQFKLAIEQDPHYAPAYAGLADCYYALSNMRVEPASAMAQARSSATRALQISPDLPEAHLSLALVNAFYDWDWPGADQHFRTAVALNPGFAEARGWYGVYLALMGRLGESTEQLQRAHELDPLSLTINWTMSLPLYLGGKYEEAIAQTRKTLELDPGFYLAYAGLGTTYEAMGDFPHAMTAFHRARELEDSPEMTAFLARGYAVSGNRQASLQLLQELKSDKPGRYVSPFDIAAIYAGLGETRETLAWLEKAFQSHAEGMAGLGQDPRFRHMRAHPGFARLLKRMHFPPS